MSSTWRRPLAPGKGFPRLFWLLINVSSLPSGVIFKDSSLDPLTPKYPHFLTGDVIIINSFFNFAIIKIFRSAGYQTK